MAPFRHASFEAAGCHDETGLDATPEAIKEAGCEAVVLATGATHLAHALPDGTSCMTLDEAAIADLEGRGVAVYDETGDWGALGLVERLAERGACWPHSSHRQRARCWRTTIYSNTLTFSRWRKKIRIRTLRRPLALADGSVVLEDVSCGEVERLTGIDTLIACIPPRAAHALEASAHRDGCDPGLDRRLSGPAQRGGGSVRGTSLRTDNLKHAAWNKIHQARASSSLTTAGPMHFGWLKKSAPSRRMLKYE